MPPRSIAGYDLVADGSDNFATRYLLTDLCFRLKSRWSRRLCRRSRGSFRHSARISVPGTRATAACSASRRRRISCRAAKKAGILGAVAGVMGTLQAVEVLKELLGLGDSLDGTLLIYEALRARFHRIRINKDADCPTCGAPAFAAARV